MDFTALDVATLQSIDPGYFIGWGTLSLLVAGIAQGKGRSGFGWWIGALLLGPVALFFLVLTDRKEGAAKGD
ncbi:MAG: hypothetical protein ISR76_00740 [Planctomycetes bacterium]|nr:hypothetical protein [Planctomycetota bacterium]MBL7007498.1 hypothetical protein [Planctomycetota bacterium]